MSGGKNMTKNKKASFFASIAELSLWRKLAVSFVLMSILPLLVLVLTYTLPLIGWRVHLITVPLSMCIAIFGLLVIKEVFDRITSVTAEAKLIASGDVSHKLEIKEPDEIGDLSEALNQLTQRIRENMDELQGYSERTAQINLDIQKRVLILSSLLQISSLISQGVKLDDILKVTIEKARLLASSDTAYLLFREEVEEHFFVKIADGLSARFLSQIEIRPQDELFGNCIVLMKPVIVDSKNVYADEILTAFYEKFKLKNTATLPIIIKGKVKAILGIGNTRSDTFAYSKDDLELMDLLAKQIAIAIENDLLAQRVGKLEIKDYLTGLYNEIFIRDRLREEIRRAILYQRPCAFVLFDIDNFSKFHQSYGSLQAESCLKKIASLIKDSVTEIDKVARCGDDEFSVVLPEKNKRKAQDIAEAIRKKIEFAFSEEPDVNKRVTVSGGVSENPLDGIEADELIRKSHERLALSKRRGRNCIVG